MTLNDAILDFEEGLYEDLMEAVKTSKWDVAEAIISGLKDIETARKVHGLALKLAKVKEEYSTTQGDV
jgi:hypothetical protein